MSRPRATAGSPESLEIAKTLRVGDRVRFLFESQARFKVRLRSDRFVILTRPHFRSVAYTVIDLEQGRRGPDDTWCCGYETADELADTLRRFEDGDAAPAARFTSAISQADCSPLAQGRNGRQRGRRRDPRASSPVGADWPGLGWHGPRSTHRPIRRSSNSNQELLEEDEAELHAVASDRLAREIDRQLLYPAGVSVSEQEATAEGVFV